MKDPEEIAKRCMTCEVEPLSEIQMRQSREALEFNLNNLRDVCKRVPSKALRDEMAFCEAQLAELKTLNSKSGRKRRKTRKAAKHAATTAADENAPQPKQAKLSVAPTTEVTIPRIRLRPIEDLYKVRPPTLPAQVPWSRYQTKKTIATPDKSNDIFKKPNRPAWHAVRKTQQTAGSSRVALNRLASSSLAIKKPEASATNLPFMKKPFGSKSLVVKKVVATSAPTFASQTSASPSSSSASISKNISASLAALGVQITALSTAGKKQVPTISPDVNKQGVTISPALKRSALTISRTPKRPALPVSSQPKRQAVTISPALKGQTSIISTALKREAPKISSAIKRQTPISLAPPAKMQTPARLPVAVKKQTPARLPVAVKKQTPARLPVAVRKQTAVKLPVVKTAPGAIASLPTIKKEIDASLAASTMQPRTSLSSVSKKQVPKNAPEAVKKQVSESTPVNKKPVAASSPVIKKEFDIEIKVEPVPPLSTSLIHSSLIKSEPGEMAIGNAEAMQEIPSSTAKKPNQKKTVIAPTEQRRGRARAGLDVAASTSGATPSSVSAVNFDQPNEVVIKKEIDEVSEYTAIGGLRRKSDEKVIDKAKSELLNYTYPPLIITAYPKLRKIKTPSNAPRLEDKLKKLLALNGKKLVEWLLKKGILKNKQWCPQHPRTEMNLGSYWDVSKFMPSGGYVWLSSCCPYTYVSVFRGSVLENYEYSPQAFLKLIYHWVNQTSSPNVVKWVGIEHSEIKKMYTLFRALCTLGVQQKCSKIGGKGVGVEVGLISLGTPTASGRSQKFEVLAAYDKQTKKIRLRAHEAMSESAVKNPTKIKEHMKILLQPLKLWVAHDSLICVDMSISVGLLKSMGFQNVSQVATTKAPSTPLNNVVVMTYLREIVPHMLRNVLGLLSLPMVQQYLDELVWREWYGIRSAHAFENILTQLAEQTCYGLDPPLQAPDDWTRTTPMVRVVASTATATTDRAATTPRAATATRAAAVASLAAYARAAAAVTGVRTTIADTVHTSTATSTSTSFGRKL